MIAHRRFISLLLLLVLVLTTQSPEKADAKYLPSTDPAGSVDPASIFAAPGIMERLAQQARQSGTARVIVRLKVAYQPEGKLAGTQAMEAQRAAIKRSQDDLLRRLAAPAKRFRFVPYLALSVNEQQLALLKDFPEVAAVEEDMPVPAALAESVPLIGATPSQTGGYTGQGQTVAILDTGVDKTHLFLAGKVVSEACYSSNESSYSATTVCPGGSEASTAVGSGVNCSVEEGCNHGTHVAGIAAGKGSSFSGVASDASIIAIQVFSRFDSTTYCSTLPCILSFTSDQILGLERVYALRGTYNIAAVNMSLGGGTYTSYCDSDNTATKTAIDNLRAAGIATVIASGNDGFSAGISAPACISSAISVGSTKDGSSGATPVDGISSFSNSASFLSLLAPGQYIYSSIPGGGYATYQGTSMATPHVTGAWAVMKSKYPDASVDRVLATLAKTGQPVLDNRNSIIKPRIQVDAALARLYDLPPQVSGFSPHRGPAGTVVEIYGSGFSKATQVLFKTTPADSFTILSPTHIRVTVPPQATTGGISVVSPDGSGQIQLSFEVGANAIPYTLANTTISGTTNGALAWADFDNDGRLDVLETGEDGGALATRLYHNNGSGSFSLINAGLPGASYGAAVWGDIDRDNDLDLLLTGVGASGTEIHLYRNQGGVFTEIPAGFALLNSSAGALGDYDNDGDLDVAVTGLVGLTTDVLNIYRNDGGATFTNINISLKGVRGGSLDWVDFNSDGNLDLFLIGRQGGGWVEKFYRNDGSGGFVDTKIDLPYVESDRSSWGDYDNDGDLDLAVSGDPFDTSYQDVFRNDGGSFTHVKYLMNLHGLAVWGDYDNDGDLDILVTGQNDVMPVALIYVNQSGAFSPTYVPLHGVQDGESAWGDYDGDHDLDLLLSGDTLAGPQAFLYRNDSPAANAVPSAPGGLDFFDDREMTLRWNSSADAQTPAAGLSYNLRVGRTPGGSEVIAPVSDPSSGLRRLPTLGNAGQGISATVSGLPLGTYYWAVQAVDASLAGSPFSAEQTFTVSRKLSFKNAAESVSEAVGIARFDVLLDSPANSPVTVDYSVESETAASGEDFALSNSATAGTLTFASGQVSQSISVQITDDTLLENEETFLLSLSNPTGGALLQRPNQERVTILDDDGFMDSGIVMLMGSWSSSTAWGDYDNDGDLDLVMSGLIGATEVTRIYRNNGGSFTDINAGLPYADQSYFDWIDYDNDGDLDLAYSSADYSDRFTRIYRNTGGVFTDAKVGLPGYESEYTAWADYDNDGDMDLLWEGKNETVLYQNNSGVFTRQNVGFPSLGYGPAAWGDYDNDGDLDLALSGEVPNTYWSYLTLIYRNNGDGTFTDIRAGLTGVAVGSTAWGDYDNDGYLDLLVNGFQYAVSGCITSLYHNNGDGTFTSVDTGLPAAGFSTSNSSWGDFDNDGDLDILLVFVKIPGLDVGETRVYRNETAGKFTDIKAGISGINWTPNSWGDYDNDADLDLALVGSYQAASHIYQNRTASKNTPPAAPTNLRASFNAMSATLRWNAAQDAQMPTASLSYNLRVGTRPGGEDILASMSNKNTGYRSVPLMGNANLRTFAVLKNLIPGKSYYWSVQAIDSAYAGSPFSAESSFTVPLPSVSLDGPTTITEDQPSVSLTVQLSYPSSQQVTVQYATSGGSAAPEEGPSDGDYQAVNGLLTFSPGETSKTITVPIREDALDEDDETIHLTLFNPVNANLGSLCTVDITIRDDDASPSIRLAADTHSAAEGDPSVAVTVVLSAASGRNVTVRYATSPGTATPGSGAADGDYTDAGGLLVFVPGETSKMITIPVIDDALDEPAETFLLDLSAPANASLGSPSQATVTITDNDSAPQLRFSSATYEIGEAQSQAVLTVQLSVASGWTVQAHYAVTSGTATGGIAPSGCDFLLAEGDLAFAPGETSKTFAVTIFDDALMEGDETANLALSAPVNASPGAPVSAVLVIHDDEAPPVVRFSAASYSAVENDGTATVTVTLSAPSGMPVSVAFATDDLTGRAGIDYISASGTLTFPAGITSRSFAVTLINDSSDNDDKTVNLALSNPINATLPANLTTAQLSILDDDPAPTVQFDSPSVQVAEGAGTAALAVKLSAASEKTVTVSYQTQDGSAVAGSDYQATSGQLTFSPGETAKAISVPISDDVLDEDDETLNLTLSNAVNASLGTAPAVNLTIQDNDATPTVRLTAATVTVNESDGQATLTASLSAASGRSVTVSYTTTAVTAAAGSDYTTSSSQLIFAPGVTSRTITIPLLVDALDEPAEAFLVDLSAPANVSLAAPSRATVTINDDDPAIQVRFSSASYTVDENQGQAVVNIQLSGPSGWIVQARYAVTGGTATAESDFTPVQGDLSFAPGETSKTFSVIVLDDALREGDETANMALSDLVNAAPDTPTSALLTIHDNEPYLQPEATFSRATYITGEKDGTATVMVTLSPPVDRPVTVDYATAGLTGKNGVDYVATSGRLTFPAWTTSQSFTVALIDDSLDNDEKTVSLALTNPTNAALPANPTTALLTILDDDPPPTVQFEQSTAHVEEGAGLVSFIVRLSAASEKTVTVDYHVVRGASIPGSDYSGGEGELTFAPGQTTESLLITILEDDQFDPGESLVLTLYAPENASTGRPSELELAITDNDPAPFYIYLPVLMNQRR